MSKKKTTFNPDWINPTVNPSWAKIFGKIEYDPFSIVCKICNKMISLSNMGKQALTSHEKSSGHQKKLRAKIKTPNTSIFFKENNVEDIDQVVSKPDTILQQKSRSVFTELDKVVQSEILWTLHIVESHLSNNSVNKTLPIFKKMFSDSPTAEKIKLSSSKLGYYITFGLGPYFNEKLEESILKCKYFVACFDESLNKVSQRAQMDIVIRYWNETKGIVESRYLRSIFMNGSTAQDILHHFKAGLKPLDLKKLLQVSMDGPNVNWKFFKLLCEEDVTLIDIGSCGLHILHGAFQTGHNNVKWMVNDALKSFYWIFNNSPARRSTYTKLTSQEIFPLKFCSIRWVESATAAHRALEIFDYIKQYVCDTNTKLPRTSTVKTLEKVFADPLIKCKIAFFATIAVSLETFLTKFQTAIPMAPFLYRELDMIVRNLLERILKKSVLKISTYHLSKLNFEDKDIYLPYSEIDVGFRTRKYLKESKATQKQKLDFISDCSLFIKAMVKKIFERCSLKYSMTKYISCLDPHILACTPAVATKRMKNLLQHFSNNNLISIEMAENAMMQYKRVQENPTFIEKFQNYTSERLDQFYSSIFCNNSYADIYMIIKMVLILSHGNASVESGFSVNKNMLIENLKERSLIARRQVYDAINSVDGTCNINIDSKMKLFCRNAHMKYQSALEEDNKKDLDRKAHIEDRKRAMKEMNDLQKKKLKLSETTKYEMNNINRRLDNLREKI